MYMPAFQAKKLVRGVSDETEVSDLQGTLAGTSRPTSRVNAAYSAEVDRLFRRNVTGDSAESALQLISTRIGHVQSRFDCQTRSAA